MNIYHYTIEEEINENQQCLYENEIISLDTLRKRFAKKGIQYPTQEAKKYLKNDLN